MSAFPAMRALVGFRTSLQVTWIRLSRRFCSDTDEPKESQELLNSSLANKLNLMGVDVKMAIERQPKVFLRLFTNEEGLFQFLREKGASSKVFASVVSRYPRSLIRSSGHLEQRWQLWRNVFNTDEEIISILDRSPESFFRASDNKNLEKSMAFFMSLKLSSEDIRRLIVRAPLTFANTVERNMQKVKFLELICSELGGENPKQFAKNIICKNICLLLRSEAQIQSNIDILKDGLKLSNSELLDLLEGRGAYILDIFNKYLKDNFNNLEQKMSLLGFEKGEIKKLIIKYPNILKDGAANLNSKLDCLLKRGITIKQIFEKPRVLDYSMQTLTERLDQLQTVEYDFQKNGISILNNSKKLFALRMKKLSTLTVTKNKAEN